jgi:hypothetical protein
MYLFFCIVWSWSSTPLLVYLHSEMRVDTPCALHYSKMHVQQEQRIKERCHVFCELSVLELCLSMLSHTGRSPGNVDQEISPRDAGAEVKLGLEDEEELVTIESQIAEKMMMGEELVETEIRELLIRAANILPDERLAAIVENVKLKECLRTISSAAMKFKQEELYLRLVKRDVKVAPIDLESKDMDTWRTYKYDLLNSGSRAVLVASLQFFQNDNWDEKFSPENLWRTDIPLLIDCSRTMYNDVIDLGSIARIIVNQSGENRGENIRHLLLSIWEACSQDKKQILSQKARDLASVCYRVLKDGCAEKLQLLNQWADSQIRNLIEATMSEDAREESMAEIFLAEFDIPGTTSCEPVANPTPTPVVNNRNNLPKWALKILSVTPTMGCSNPIAALTNFCRHQLKFDVIFEYEEQHNAEQEELTYRCMVVFPGREIVAEYSHARRKYAKEQAAKLAIKRLNDDKDFLLELIYKFRAADL